MKVPNPPDPHPIDFDWRFAAETVQEISELFLGNVPTIAIGAPSIARCLEQRGQDVLLVDRQPFQAVHNQLQVEVGRASPDVGPFFHAIVDPPWYPTELHNWVAWTANLMKLGGEIYVSIWPDEVRPKGHLEAAEFIRWANFWASVETLPLVPLYEEPLFEKRAAAHLKVSPFSKSPRRGRLLKLSLNRIPSYDLPEPVQSKKGWIRFVLNDYQLALNLDAKGAAQTPITFHPEASGWQWPYVSRRAPKRDLIGLWSSENEVAIVRHPSKLKSALRSAIQQSRVKDFKETIGEFEDILQWRIPMPPYRRSFEWRHL